MTPSMMPPSQQPQKQMTALVIVLVVGGVAALCCIGTLAAIAVPNFLKFKSRSMTSEVKSNLKYAYTAQRAHFGEKDAYSERIEDVGFLPERGNRYRYFFSLSGTPLLPGTPGTGTHTGVSVDYAKHPAAPSEAAMRSALPASLALGVSGSCPDACSVVMAAVGNIDSDTTLDVWSVSTADRVIDGEKVPAGVPYAHVDDTKK